MARFIETAARVDAGCAARFMPAYGVGTFARTAAGAAAPPIAPAGGDRSRLRDRRVAAMAWAAAYDAIQRSFRMSGDRGAGLRGGSFTLSFGDAGLDVGYDGARFTDDVAVDGTAHWEFATGEVTARLVVDGPRGADGALIVAGRLFPHNGPLTATGTIGGRRIAVLVPSA